MNLFNLMATISLDDKEYKNKIKEAGREGKNLGSIFSQVSDGTSKIGQSISAVGEASSNLAKKVTLTGAAMGAVITGLTLHGGFARAMAVEEAQSKLKGLGHSTEDIKQIMDNALASVKGTAFGLGDAASLAAQLVAAGIEPGQELEKTLKTVADTAAISGRDIGEVGLIFSKVAAKGKLQGGELLSLMESGIPVLQLLGTNSKVTERAMAEFGDSSTESIQKLVSSGKVSFEEFEEAMRNNVGGAALEMGNTFRGSLSNMKAALGRIGAEIVTPFMDWVVVISKKLIPAIDEMGGKVKETVPKIIDFLQNSKAVKPIIMAIVGAITTAAIPGLIGMAAASISATLPLLPLIAAGATLGAIFNGIKNTSGFAKAALIALGIVVGTFTAVMIGLTVATKISTLTQSLGTAAILIKTSTMTASAVAMGVVTAAQWLLNAALTANPIGLVIVAIVGLIAILGVLFVKNETFRNVVINTWEAIKSTGEDAWNWIKKFFTEDIPSAFNSLIDFIKKIPQLYINFWKSIFDKTKEWATNLGTYLAEAIPNIIKNVIEWFGKLPHEIGYALGYALASIYKWGQDVWNNMYNASKNAVNAVINWFKELPNNIWTWLVNTINKVKQFAIDLGQKSREAGMNMVSNIMGAVKNLPSQMAEVGANIVRGVWDGIVGMGNWIGEKVNGFFTGIVGGAKKALGIHSPSRVFRDQVGVYMAQGVGVGFEEEMDDVNADIQNSLMYDFDTPNLEQEKDNKIDQVVNLLGRILDKDTTVDIDGRELMRSLSPYQEEFREYDSRNPSFA